MLDSLPGQAELDDVVVLVKVLDVIMVADGGGVC